MNLACYVSLTVVINGRFHMKVITYVRTWCIHRKRIVHLRYKRIHGRKYMKKKIEVGTYLFASIVVYDDSRQFLGEARDEVVLNLCDGHLISEYLGIFIELYGVQKNYGYYNPGIGFGIEQW